MVNSRSFVKVCSRLDVRSRSEVDASVEEVVGSVGAEVGSGRRDSRMDCWSGGRSEEAIADGSGGFDGVGMGDREREAACWYEDFGERREVQDSRSVLSLKRSVSHVVLLI